MRVLLVRFDWWFPICVLTCVGAALFPLTISSSDFSALLYVFATVPIVSFALLYSAKKSKDRQRYAAFLLFALFLVFTAVMFTHFSNTRATIRWFFRGREIQDEVLSQAIPADGRFRHVEWEGWGFAGAGDTVVYLVSDPNDSLISAARSGLPGKFVGLPCEVVRVHRLEQGWYTALFYTDTDWDHCS